MKPTRWLVAALSGAALVLVPGTASSVATAPVALPQNVALTDAGPSGPGGQPGDDQPGGRPGGRPQPPAPSGSLCRPGTPPDAPQTTQFYDGNPLLGPAQLPYASPVGPLLAGYQRLGAQSESQWLANWTAGGQLRFPPENGFVLGPDGRPVKQRQMLIPGYRLDRFGFPGGAFLSPLGTPFGSRALAPQSLNTPPTPPATTPPAPLANYHTYCVLKPFDVDSGPIAPWFAQPGMGTQFQLNPAYVPQAGALLTVQWLLDNHYIVEENLLDAAPPCAAEPLPRQGGAGGGVTAC